jgi:hypothetical protein
MKLRTNTALALLVAVVAVPAAHSGTRAQPSKADTSDAVSRYLGNQVQPTTTDAEDVVARYLNNRVQSPSTDAEDVVARYLNNRVQVPPPTTDAEDVVARYLDNQVPVLTGPQTSVTGEAFDWADAGMGAAVVLGAALVLIGGGLLALRKRGRLAV